MNTHSVVLSLADRGLVVLSAFGHAGIVNTVRYGRRLTGQDAGAAIVGGFRLRRPMFEPIIGPVVEALAILAERLMPGKAGLEQRLPVELAGDEHRSVEQERRPASHGTRWETARQLAAVAARARALH